MMMGTEVIACSRVHVLAIIVAVILMVSAPIAWLATPPALAVEDGRSAATEEGASGGGAGSAGSASVQDGAEVESDAESDSDDDDIVEPVATECTVAELIAVEEDLDGAVVRVTGEVVGEAIDAGDGEHTWIAISADGVSMSVWMTTADAETIQHYGDYDEIGDTITVEGIYHMDCSAHDGDLDIHVTSMTLDDEGSASVAELDVGKLRVAIVIVAVGLVLGFVYWRLSERQR